MRIEAIDRIRDRNDDGSDLHMEPGDIKQVGDIAGARCCRHGWAKDVDGNVPTGAKSTNPAVVEAQALKQGTSTQ